MTNTGMSRKESKIIKSTDSYSLSVRCDCYSFQLFFDEYFKDKNIYGGFAIVNTISGVGNDKNGFIYSEQDFGKLCSCVIYDWNGQSGKARFRVDDRFYFTYYCGTELIHFCPMWP